MKLLKYSAVFDPNISGYCEAFEIFQGFFESFEIFQGFFKVLKRFAVFGHYGML